jgi:hypothetical protein
MSDPHDRLALLRGRSSPASAGAGPVEDASVPEASLWTASSISRHDPTGGSTGWMEVARSSSTIRPQPSGSRQVAVGLSAVRLSAGGLTAVRLSATGSLRLHSLPCSRGLSFLSPPALDRQSFSDVGHSAVSHMQSGSTEIERERHCARDGRRPSPCVSRRHSVGCLLLLQSGTVGWDASERERRAGEATAGALLNGLCHLR